MVDWISPAEAALFSTRQLQVMARLLQHQLCPDAARQVRNMDRSLRNVTKELQGREKNAASK